MAASAETNNEPSFARADFRLHDLILEHAGNERARSIVTALRETTSILGVSTADRTRSLNDIDSEHAPIIAAIARGDQDAAAEAMKQHLTNTGRLLVAQSLATMDDPPTLEEIWSLIDGSDDDH